MIKWWIDRSFISQLITHIFVIDGYIDTWIDTKVAKKFDKGILYTSIQPFFRNYFKPPWITSFYQEFEIRAPSS